MQAFKKGDVVTCVDNEDMEHTIYIGASYTVTDIDCEFVFLEGMNTLCFSSRRFILGNKILSPFQQWEKEYA